MGRPILPLVVSHWDANPFFNPYLAEQKEERNGTNLQGGTANQSHGSNNTASSGTLDETTSTNKETEADDPEESEPVPPASDPCEGKESEFSVCTSIAATTNPPSIGTFDAGVITADNTFDGLSAEFGDDKVFNGGIPNRIAQLGDCLELVVPAFKDIGEAAKKLLGTIERPEDAEINYQIMPTYWQAVFLNTVAAAASPEVGVDFSNATFDGFYMSTKKSPNTSNRTLPYGIYVTGSNKTEKRHASIGSVELDTTNGVTQMDVDLYNPLSGIRNFFRHQKEDAFNTKHQRPTHPGDVARQLKARGVVSGVSCR